VPRSNNPKALTVEMATTAPDPIPVPGLPAAGLLAGAAVGLLVGV